MSLHPPPSAADRGVGLYIYGIVPEDGLLPTRVGIDGLHPLTWISWKKVKAVSSCVSLTEFGEEALRRQLEDLRWLEAKLRAHEAIVEEIMRRQPILPCKFGTIYRSVGRVQQVIEEHYPRYLEALTFLRDKEEWGVKVYAEVNRLVEQVLRTDDQSPALAASPHKRSPGHAYLLQKHRGRQLNEHLEDTLANLSGQVAQTLALQAVQAELVSTAVRLPTTPGTRLILNAAYLIAKARVNAFLSCCQALDERFATLGIRLVLSGPWPPYHFIPKLESATSVIE